jgi:nucleoside 2-deoxyribosyltransferase
MTSYKIGGGKRRTKMRKVYICSPYRAKDEAELDRNIDYAQELTKLALEADLAPITPHLYMTQCLNENNEQERAQGMAAGMELLKICDFVIAGIKYGISNGMQQEINAALELGIKVVNAEQIK